MTRHFVRRVNAHGTMSLVQTLGAKSRLQHRINPLLLPPPPFALLPTPTHLGQVVRRGAVALCGCISQVDLLVTRVKGDRHIR